MGEETGHLKSTKRSTFWTLKASEIHREVKSWGLKYGVLSLEIKSTEHKISLENEKPSSVWEISHLRFWQDFQKANSLWECLAGCGGEKSNWINTYIRDEHIKQLIIYGVGGVFI